MVNIVPNIPQVIPIGNLKQLITLKNKTTMRTLLSMIAVIMSVIPAIAQNDYRNGIHIHINDSTTWKCSIFKNYIGLQNISKYDFDTISGSITADPADYSIFKRAFDETFRPEEQVKYGDVWLSIEIILTGEMQPVDVGFSFENKAPANTIPIARFITLRQKILNYVSFPPNPYAKPDKYYRWCKGIGTIHYYLNMIK